MLGRTTPNNARRTSSIGCIVAKFKQGGALRHQWRVGRSKQRNTSRAFAKKGPFRCGINVAKDAATTMNKFSDGLLTV
jgi:hypothetical protein